MDTTHKRLLIVEDEPDLREALKTTFELEGFAVDTAENGEVGLAKALEAKPDLILLDVVMPIMDGIAMLKKLKEDEWGKEAKVLVMTALDDLEKVAEVMDAGGAGYFVKSQTPLTVIVAKVKETLKME